VRLTKSTRHLNENTNINIDGLNIAICSHKFYSKTYLLYVSKIFVREKREEVQSHNLLANNKVK